MASKLFTLGQFVLRLVVSSRWKLAWPALGLGLLVTVLLFPVEGAAGLALVALVGLCGAALAEARARFRFKLPAWAPDLIIALVVCGVSALVFKKSWNDSGYRIYDWAAHHANLKHLTDGLRQGHIPSWVHSVSTGDSPFDLYAFLPYYFAAKAALLTDTTDLTLVLVRSAIVIHSLTALGAALLTRRVVRWPWGIVVGLASLYDIGSVRGGGVDGLFAMGVAHSAFAQAIWSFALIALVESLKRPGLWKSVCIWALVALAVACHPLAIVSALATIVALVMVALLARDSSVPRALVGVGHVFIGVLLVAFVWMPFGGRVLLYGVHYGLAPELASVQFQQALSQAVPETSVGPLVYAGGLGVLVGVLSRRAAPTLLACFAAVVMAGIFDQVYTLLDLVPSLETSRFQMVRLPAAAKASIYACGVYLVDTALAKVRLEAAGRSRHLVGALLAVAAVCLVRGGHAYFNRIANEIRSLAFLEVPDSEGLRALASWAREQNAAMRPDQYGRLYDEDEHHTFLVYHVNAESGLPTLWLGPTLPMFFLRERIEDASPSSLRRFNVRWVMRADRPPSLGDPATEQRFGRYIVRELPEWDGLFARVERGAGEVVVTHLENERVDVELKGTTEPALVALGMGYYPRWQATHEKQGELPVYALPSFDGARLHVVGAWLAPGRTTFRPSGALPSDGKGRGFTALAALLAASIIAVWARRPRLRTQLLFGMARACAWLKRHRKRVGLAAFGLFVLMSLGASIVSSRRPAKALQIGNGLRAGALVEVRSGGGEWRSCGYAALYGTYRCPGRVVVQDSVAGLLNDAPPSLPFVVPVIHVASPVNSIQLRVSMKARLEGEYWAGTNGGVARLDISGEPKVKLSGRSRRHIFLPAGVARDITLTTSVPAGQVLQIAFVQRMRLEPERGYVSAPEKIAH